MMKFKNNSMRNEFLEKSRSEDGWFVWKEDKDLGWKMLRVDFEKFYICKLIMQQTAYYPKEEIKWYCRAFYLISGEAAGPFEDQRCSKTQIVDYLRATEKNDQLNGPLVR